MKAKVAYLVTWGVFSKIIVYFSLSAQYYLYMLIDTESRQRRLKMTTDDKKRLMSLTENDIMKVYSGKPGCMCGCKGIYRVHPLHLAAANKSRGYDYDAKAVNLSMVKKVLGYIQASDDASAFDGGFDAIINGRQYAVYLVK